MFVPTVIESIKQHAIKDYPNESCGVVVKSDDGEFVYRELPNLAAEPENTFEIDERLLIALGDKLAAVVHSHPMGPDYPSQADMEQQVAWNVPFGIVSTDGVGCLPPFFWGDSVPIPPLIGRGFRHGVTDCYAMVRDYYREKLNITLNEYPREWGWWQNGQSLYQDFFEREGFSRITPAEVREHDCFLAQIRSDTPNHAGVYVGGNLILHHLTSSLGSDPARISRREPVAGWAKFICGFWVRHESQQHD